MAISSVLYGLFLFAFQDTSQLKSEEKHSFFHWNKEIVFKSYPSNQAEKVWLIATTQKYSFYGVILYLIASVFVYYVQNT